MFGNIVGSLIGGGSAGMSVKGTVVLMKKNVLDFNDFTAGVLDGVSEFLGQAVSFQLVSATVGDPNNGNRGVVGKPAYLVAALPSLLPKIAAGESELEVVFNLVEGQGVPGAFIVNNLHPNQFFLKTLTLEDFPGVGRIHFVCNSWVYPASNYQYDRIFFANHTYLPGKTPAPLVPYRHDELFHLRGDSVTGPLQEWDRVYNYAYYNDLGDPDSGASSARPVLGGSQEYPYPRRGKTGRAPTKTDPNSESRLPLLSLDNYVPRDERFGHIKMSDFLANAIKALSSSVIPLLKSILNPTPNEFDSFQDVLDLYEGGLPLPQSPLLDQLTQAIPFEMVKEVVRPDGKRFLKFPLPHVIQEDKWAWRTDEEFARELLAGVNPVIIRRLEEFPPTSKLDPQQYGNQNSSITAADVEKNLDGLTVDQALKSNRLFILDHHDAVMPYLNRINFTTSVKTYATRTLLFLKDDDTLKPLAIELSLPNPAREQDSAVSKVCTPAESGVEWSLWQLAKAYVEVNDYGIHEVISHWLNTHAVMEPFVIATNRHLSAMHPIYKLLAPHYRDTMNINALARQSLINAGGIIEQIVFPTKYAIEISSKVYKSWNFTEQALPNDLLKRGMAVEDPQSPNGIRLLIKDYPYAVDGLSIWSAIETWVTEYIAVYYADDAALQADIELTAWWTEVREVGHGDRKDEEWWPKLESLSELAQTCTTIIWIGSALHAAVNFGQYPFAGYHPNRPTLSRRLLPEPGTTEYAELQANPEKAFLRTLSTQLQAIIGISVVEILSTHASDEVYLGQSSSPEWTSDKKVLEAFQRFGTALAEIEQKIVEMNKDASLKNRKGPVELPYNLLYPTGKVGITAMGVPNSISI